MASLKASTSVLSENSDEYADDKYIHRVPRNKCYIVTHDIQRSNCINKPQHCEPQHREPQHHEPGTTQSEPQQCENTIVIASNVCHKHNKTILVIATKKFLNYHYSGRLVNDSENPDRFDLKDRFIFSIITQFENL